MKISTLLDHIDSGHMALPEFQRGYVWNRDQVRGLFDSLYRRHPVGGLLVWATESKTATHRGDGQIAPNAVDCRFPKPSQKLRTGHREKERTRLQPLPQPAAYPPRD